MIISSSSEWSHEEQHQGKNLFILRDHTGLLTWQYRSCIGYMTFLYPWPYNFSYSSPLCITLVPRIMTYGSFDIYRRHDDILILQVNLCSSCTWTRILELEFHTKIRVYRFIIEVRTAFQPSTWRRMTLCGASELPQYGPRNSDDNQSVSW